MADAAQTLDLWHKAVFDEDMAALEEVLADDVLFHAPLYLKPRRGKPAVMAVLGTAIDVFENFTYHRELIDGDNWCLEFEASVDEFSLKGIDLIRLDEDGKILDFEVFIRPANALAAFGAKMAKTLEERGLITQVQNAG